MRKMIWFRDCLAPVLLAMGLWLLGNGLMGITSARGQEVAGTGFYTCDPLVFGPTPTGGRCSFNLQQQQCTGTCSFSTISETVCNSFAVTGSTVHCSSPVIHNGASGQDYYGICTRGQATPGFPQPYACICILGAPKGASYPVDGTVCSFPA